jgi:hypothetical protein
LASAEDILMEFVTASTTEQAAAVANRHPELLDPAAIRLLDRIIAQTSAGSPALPQLRVARDRLAAVI